MSGKKKPELTLLKDPSLDEIVALCERITGRKSTPEEIEEARKTLAAGKKNG